eukprot:gene20286-biopygen19104
MVYRKAHSEADSGPKCTKIAALEISGSDLARYGIIVRCFVPGELLFGKPVEPPQAPGMLSKGGVVSSVWRKRRNFKELQKHIAPRITFGSLFRAKLQKIGGVGKIGVRSYQIRFVTFSISVSGYVIFGKASGAAPATSSRPQASRGWPRGEPQGSSPKEWF